MDYDDAFLGKGVALSFDIGKDGSIKFSSLQELVKESIFIILSTKIGERVMNYDFGCKVHELMFEMNNVSTIGKAKIYVNEAIKRWEKRVDIIKVNAESVSSNEILIDVTYSINDINVVDNLVYPFYLSDNN